MIENQEEVDYFNKIDAFLDCFKKCCQDIIAL